MANELRTLIKNGSIQRSAKTNLLLFTAARHEIWHTVALPALESGTWVVAARNYYSTLTYQGYGEGLDIDLIESMTQTFTDDQYIHPDVSVILSLDSHEERLKRIGQRGELENPDTFESRDNDFQSRIQNGYHEIAKQKDLPVISAEQSPEQILQEITAIVRAL